MAEEFRIVVIGDGGVGKSATTVRLLENKFVEEYDPTIEDSYRFNMLIDDQNCLLDILDTAGQEEYSAMRCQYIRSAEGFLVMYAIDSMMSFDKLGEHYWLIQRIRDDDVPLVLLGNKCDLENERQVSTEEGEELSEILHCPFYETSAKDSINVILAFSQLVREIKANRNRNQLANREQHVHK